MGFTLDTLNDVRRQNAAADPALGAARERRDTVLRIAERFPGTLRTYRSGSLATGLMNRPVTDGDGGVVLDRRVYAHLCPDGDNVGPLQIVEQMRAWVQDEVVDTYPNAKVAVMKRGLVVEVHEPLDEDQDPTVDLVVALNRKVDDAVWIPRIDWVERSHRWDPAHPEKHVQLLLAGTKELVRSRAHVIRVGKAWKHQLDPEGMCSFLVTALGRECTTEPVALDMGMLTFFEYAADAIEAGPVDDPAHVSGPIKLEDEPGRAVVVQRLRGAGTALRTALDHDDDEAAVLEALAPVFPDFVKPPTASSSKAGLGAAIRSGTAALGLPATGTTLQSGTSVVHTAKRTQSFGASRGPRR
jgi:hypothetical protein